MVDTVINAERDLREMDTRLPTRLRAVNTALSLRAGMTGKAGMTKSGSFRGKITR
ncbi:MAG: hypothetical protein LBF86_09270 [Helicobacteraceae bacterium]|nr:hypothetical protein [Helicobacteraceae bacterium]